MVIFQITFKTKIYHPNIDEKGQVCLPIISPENWKPAIRTDKGRLVPLVSNLVRLNTKQSKHVYMPSISGHGTCKQYDIKTNPS